METNIYALIYMCIHIMCTYIWTCYMNSENVKFIVVNLKEDVVKYIFTTISFRLTMINFTFSEYIIYICIHIYIYIYISPHS